MKHRKRAWSALFSALPLLLAACHTVTPVPRDIWAAANRSGNQIEVRTLSGAEFKLDSFSFTNRGLMAWRGEQSHGDVLRAPMTIPLSDIAVVRMRELDRGKTMLVVAGAVTAAYVAIALGRSSERPEAQQRPVSTSCPFIYSFDGSKYIFDSETYAGAVARALERTDIDNLEHLKDVGGKYRLLLSNEMEETHYTDELSLIIADHPTGTRVLPDAQGSLHVVGTGIAARHVVHYEHLSSPLRARWDVYFRGKPPKNPALVLRIRNTDALPFVHDRLMNLLGRDVYSWYHAVNNDVVKRERVVDWYAKMGGLEVSVLSAGGRASRTVVMPVGPMIAKSVVVPLGALPAGEPLKIRLESSPMLWQVEAIELADEEGMVETSTAKLTRAVTADGRDVQSELSTRDGQYHVALRGDRVSIEFDSPPVRAGMVRTVLARTVGHYYVNSNDTAPGHPGLVSRLMTRSGFSQAYFVTEYLRRTRINRKSGL